MTVNDLKRIKDFYEQVILQKIVLPIEINDIYCLIVPTEKNPLGLNYRIKQRTIAVFVQNRQWEVLNMLEEVLNIPEDSDLKSQSIDSTETAGLTQPSVVGESSHSENNPIGNSQDGIRKRIEELQLEYSVTTDTGRKRSISMKVNNLKKKLR